MLVRSKKRWEIPEAEATPEWAYLDRRRLLASFGAGAGLALFGAGVGRAQEAGPLADLFPAERNDAFVLDREITPEEVNLRFNNFYEFGSQKTIHVNTGDFRTRPWTVRIDGMVEAEQTLDLDTLVRSMPVEERLYRHRCVEAWSMTVPWTGFALRALVEAAKPLSSAKYVRFETFLDPDQASGQRQVWYPWPYVEGLTIAEATNDLAFVVIGAYGKPVATQMGAPIRLALPWKYGFKSIKSIVRMSFTDERPVSFWERIQPSEYGFWANVNPEVPHPRWSQATERILHTEESVPTLLFNGYAEEVAGLYAGLEGEKLYT